MRVTSHSQPNLISGRIITNGAKPKNHLAGRLKATGIYLIGQGDMAWLKQGRESILWRGVNIIVHASGHKHSYLVGYLLGVDDRGTLYEIFLEIVQGTRSTLFKPRVATQRQLLGLAATLLGPGISARQRILAVV
jgi:hypothetical protein